MRRWNAADIETTRCALDLFEQTVVLVLQICGRFADYNDLLWLQVTRKKCQDLLTNCTPNGSADNSPIFTLLLTYLYTLQFSLYTGRNR